MRRVRIRNAAMILVAATLASRVLGLLRNTLFASVFGSGDQAVAFIQALLVSDFIYNIVAGGALTSAFLPVFTHYMVGEHDQKTAWRIASTVLNLSLAIMIVISAFLMFFARQLVPLYNYGLSARQLDLIAALMRITLLQAIVMAASIIIGSMLNARHYFMRPAIGSVLYNVGSILGLLVGALLIWSGKPNHDVAVYAATWGIVLGALLQVAVQLPGLLKIKMHYSFVWDWRNPGVLAVGRQMLPRILNSAMLYLTVSVDRNLLLFLGVLVGQKALQNLVAQYNYAFQLALVPIGILGMSVSTAVFPTLAEYVAQGRIERVRNTFLSVLRSIFFLAIPMSAVMIILSLPLIQLVLEHGRFSLYDAQATAIPLAFFALGLAAQAAVEILVRAFYALHDTRTPTIVSVMLFVMKIALGILLLNVALWGVQWGMAALAFATSFTAILETGFLLWLLHQRLGGLHLRRLADFVVRVLCASMIMAIALLLTRYVLDLMLNTTQTPSLGLIGTIFVMLKLAIEGLVGLFIFVRAAQALHIEEAGIVERIRSRVLALPLLSRLRFT